MEYILTVLTNGRQECLARTLEAFERFITPRPTQIFIHIDGNHPPPRLLYDEMPWQVSVARDPVGFTFGTDDCYATAAQSGLDWTFHLEDDFVILEPIDLRDIAAVLDAEPHLAQMAQIRTPWGHEIPHGGYIPQNQDSYERKSTRVKIGKRQVEHRWIETSRNWATNPALMKTQFFRDNPWPLVPLSEGVYGFQIRERNPAARFGLWGWGGPKCAHIGVDRVKGAHGY